MSNDIYFVVGVVSGGVFIGWGAYIFGWSRGYKEAWRRIIKDHGLTIHKP